MPRQRAVRPSKEQIAASRETMKRLFAYIFKHFGLQFVVVFACIIVSVLANVQGTLFMQTLIDDYISPMLRSGSTDFSPLLAAVARVALFYLIGIAAAFIYNLIMVYVSQGLQRRLRCELFEHMETLPIRYFDTHAHGDIMSFYTNDIDTLRQMVSQSIPQGVNSLFTIVSVTISMLILSVPLTLLTFAMVGVMLVVTTRLAGLSAKYFTAQQKDIGIVNGNIQEIMNGQKVVKVFCHEDAVIEEFDRLNEQLFDSAYNANKFANILMPANAQLGNVSYVLIAVVGGALAITGATGLTLGKLASFLTFNKSFNMPISQVSQQLNFIVMAMAGAGRIFALLDEEPEVDEGYVRLVNARVVGGTGLADGAAAGGESAGRSVDVAGGSETSVELTDESTKDGSALGENASADGVKLVECEERTGAWAWKHYHKLNDSTTYTKLAGDVVFDDVDFGYNEEKTVLHNISLHALPGQKIAFVGATGAGKTTITNLINRFYDIADGKIRYDGININKIKKADLRRSLGIVLQDTHLFTGTVADNIRYGKLEATDEEVLAAAKLANADGFIRRLSDGYDTMLSGDGGSLSTGQRQLLAIARAAIADPPVLILDEATSSIDTRTERIVQDGMDRLMKGRTTFVIAHRLSTIRNSEMICVLDAGRIIERGNHEELLEKKGKYYQLYTGKVVNA